MNRIVLRWPPECRFELELQPEIKRIQEEVEANEPPEEIFYTDGACTGNGKPHCAASWAVVATMNPKLTTSGLVSGIKPTNQIAEIMAVVKALEVAETNAMKTVTIITDSKYAFGALNGWIEQWENNGWMDCKRKKVVNRELLERLSRLVKTIRTKCIHVKGHGSDDANNQADQLARKTLEASICPMLIMQSSQIVNQSDDYEIQSIMVISN